MPKHQSHDLRSLSYAMAANIETKRYIYGLMTASYSGFDAKHIELTHQREFLISTRKSALLTSHSFSDGEIFHLLNMHGINFVSSKVFNKELEKVTGRSQLSTFFWSYKAHDGGEGVRP